MEEDFEDNQEECDEEEQKDENEDMPENEDYNKEDFSETPGENTVVVEEKVTVTEERTLWGHAPQEIQGQQEKSRGYAFTEGEAYRRLSIGEVMSTNVGFGQMLRRIVREAWGAIPPSGRPALRSPATKIRFTQTGSTFCSTTNECIRHCRDLQKYYMDLGFPDIPYNFMIGGDGILYHGRGWVKQAERSPAFHKLKKTTIDIAFIGDFIEKKIPYQMLATAADTIKYGLKLKRIVPFFQTFTYLTEHRRS